jgi:hypothetical protein
MMLEMNIDRFSMIFSIPDHGTGTLCIGNLPASFSGGEKHL